jgi:hypothetical protein
MKPQIRILKIALIPLLATTLYAEPMNNDQSFSPEKQNIIDHQVAFLGKKQSMESVNTEGKSKVFDKDFLSGFETCSLSEEFFKIRKKTILSKKPIETYDFYLTYRVKTFFMGLPVNKITYGICSGGTPELDECSLAMDVTIMLDTNLSHTQEQLKKISIVILIIVRKSVHL